MIYCKLDLRSKRRIKCDCILPVDQSKKSANSGVINLTSRTDHRFKSELIKSDSSAWYSIKNITNSSSNACDEEFNLEFFFMIFGCVVCKSIVEVLSWVIDFVLSRTWLVCYVRVLGLYSDEKNQMRNFLGNFLRFLCRKIRSVDTSFHT